MSRSAALITWVVFLSMSGYPLLGQDEPVDSVSVKSDVQLDPELIDVSEEQPEVIERLFEQLGDQKNLPRDEYKWESTIQDDGKCDIVFRVQEQALQAKIIMPDPQEMYIDIDEDGRAMMPVQPYDSRFEISNLTLVSAENQKVITNSFSVMGIVSNVQLARTKNGFQAHQTTSLQQRYGVCPGEPYAHQPVLCLGTAFLVADDVVLTARHNLQIVPLSKMMFLIGYKVLAGSGKANLEFRPDDVYGAADVLRSKMLDQLDLVLIRLNRKVKSAVVLRIEAGFEARLNESVYALGYPVGLPLKYTTNASIKSKESDLICYTTLDTFKGNSGSPVFSRRTHNVIGVLVEGGVDFRHNGNCVAANICSDQGCKGEKVVSLGVIRDHILSLIK